MVKAVGSLVAAAIVAVTGGAMQASAATFSVGGSTYTTEFNAGSGDNHALLALQYGSANYLFGYSWAVGTTISGEDLLVNVGNASGGSLKFDLAHYSFGDFISNIAYAPANFTDTSPVSTDGYYVGTDAANLPYSNFGAADVTVSNGDIDAWVYLVSYEDPAPTSVSIVPEPASLGLLAIGGLALVKRSR